MTSIISAGQSISSIGKSMTAIARVEEHLATFMKKVIYYEKFFQRMGPNLPGGVVDTAKLIFLRCYEYRDEIRDELESSVAYVADAGRWVVGIGDWNSKMEKRLAQISELVLLTNALLAEYAVTGEVGADDARDELDAYLQLLSATVTLKNVPVNGKSGLPTNGQRTADGRPPVARAKSNTFEEFSSEMTGLGNELTGAFSEMFGSKDLGRSKSLGAAQQGNAGSVKDNDAMNPFTESYRRPVDPYAVAASSTSASVSSSVQSLPGASTGGPMPPIGTDTENSMSDGETPESPLSPVSLGEYECLDMESIPKYAAFKSSAQLAARRQHGYGNGTSLAGSMLSEGGRSAYSESSAEYHDLFPMAPASSQTVSRSVSSLEKAPIQKKSTKPIMDMNYSYDFQCEVAHNPFLSPNTPGPIAEPLRDGLNEVNLTSSSAEGSTPVNGCAVASSPTASTTMKASVGVDQEQVSGALVGSASEDKPVLATVAPPPTLHPAVEYSQAAVAEGSQSWHAMELHQSGHYDETEALAAALAASVADQQQHDSDHEYDLFGCGKQ